MRAKKSKNLRAAAKELTKGLEFCSYEGGSPPLYEKLKNGTIIKRAVGIPRKLRVDCTRGLYKWLKRGKI